MKHSITFNNKKYNYIVKPIDDETIFFECKGAGISQSFHIEDVPGIIMNLPEFILSQMRFQKKRKEMLRMRVSSEDKKEIQKRAVKAGYSTISEFLRDLALGKTEASATN